MEQEKTNNKAATVASRGGISFFTLLGLIFITLKLINIEPVASWSWLWVLSPLWAMPVLGVALFLVFVLVALIFGRGPRG